MGAHSHAILVVALIGVGAVGWIGFHPAAKGAGRPAVDGSVATDLRALKEQVAELEAARASNERHAEPVETPMPVAVPAQQSAPRGGPPPPSRAELQAREEARLKHLDDLATNEARDGAWAPGYERQIETAVSSSVAKDGTAKIESLRCRTSLCRLELSYATPGDQALFMASFRTHLPPLAAVHFSDTSGANGVPRTTIDLLREGTPVPGVDD
jgi:hypothetical protein